MLPEELASPWAHPTLSPPDPWIVGDVGRWLIEEPPPVAWIVEGLIPAGVPGAFAARAGGGKSMTALLIALGLTSGRGVLGRAVSPGAARGVLFVGLEDDEPDFQRRFRRGMELLQEDGQWTAQDEEAIRKRLVPLFPNRTIGARFSLEAQWQGLAKKAKAIPGGCGLIILDTLARMSEGDENSASETRPFMEAQAALVQATGASVIAIHHVGKGNDTPSGKKLHERLHPEALRGSSAIEAGARFILTMAALSPQEAAKAGLDESEALNGGLVALKLAKASQSEKGLTVLLERRHEGEAGAGFLVPHPDSERALAVIQGDAATLKLSLRDKVLRAIAEVGHLGDLDQKAAAVLIWPDAQDASGQWRKALTALRSIGYLADRQLTDAGWAHVKTLKSGSGWNSVDLQESHQAQVPCAVPPGTLETEQAEQNTSLACSIRSNPLDPGNGWNSSGEDMDEVC